jgi:thiamine biosynthesis lipoprotein
MVGEKSVVTSGIYERSFTAADGKFYHHILDPKTGYPVENSLSAVSIISDLSVDGDGLSTTCFLLGIEEATALIESIPNTEAIFITKDNQIFMTSGLGKDIPYQLLTAQ